MSQQVCTRTLSYPATCDLSNYIYHLVMLDTSAIVPSITLGSADCVVIGSLQDKPKLGDSSLVGIGETVKVVAGAIVAIGNEIVCDANGCGVPKGSAHNVFGICQENGVSNDIVEVLVRPYYH